ncbi:MAG: MarR family winged helix-turn-helix transcriptional regulator [Sarcina sp.]
MNDDYLELIRKIALFRKKYHTYIAEAIKELNISSSEFSYLKELIHNDGVIQDVIVKNTCVDKAAASRLIKSLEEKNIIAREKNELDKRSMNVFLTEKGKDLAPLIDKIMREWYSNLEESMGKDNLHTLNELLQNLNDIHP